MVKKGKHLNIDELLNRHKDELLNEEFDDFRSECERIIQEPEYDLPLIEVGIIVARLIVSKRLIKSLKNIEAKDLTKENASVLETARKFSDDLLDRLEKARKKTVKATDFSTSFKEFIYSKEMKETEIYPQIVKETENFKRKKELKEDVIKILSSEVKSA